MGAPNRVDVRTSTYWCESIPPLPIRAIASPSASMTEPIRKLALSLTRSGGPRRLGDNERLLSDSLEKRGRRSDGRLLSRGDHIELPGRGDVGAAEHGSCHKALSNNVMNGREALANPTLIVLEEIWIAAAGSRSRIPSSHEHHDLDGIVVREHRENRIAATGIRDRGGLLGPSLHQGFGFHPRAMVDGDLIAGFEQICRHACAHVAQPDETDLHDHG